MATSPAGRGRGREGAARQARQVAARARRAARSSGGDGGRLLRGVAYGAAAVLAAVAGVVGVLALVASAEGDGECFDQRRTDLASNASPLWSLELPREARPIVLALDDEVGHAPRGGTFLDVAPVRGNARRALPRRIRVGASVRGTLTDGTRPLGFPVVARAQRSRDGRGIDVFVCARRPTERDVSRPGRYRGTVRVAGPRLESADVPVEVTIKAARTELFVLAGVVAFFGALLGAANSRTADRPARDATGFKRVHYALAALPFLTGLIAGCVAALAVYLDDPTFGAQRGADTAKLVAVTFAAAAGGLTVAAPPSRGLRRKLPG